MKYRTLITLTSTRWFRGLIIPCYLSDYEFEFLVVPGCYSKHVVDMHNHMHKGNVSLIDAEIPVNRWKLFLYHSDLMQNSALNSRAAAEAGIAGEFGLEDFTYNNTSILEVLSHHLSTTDFLGITVRQTQSELLDCKITSTYPSPYPIHTNTWLLSHMIIADELQIEPSVSHCTVLSST